MISPEAMQDSATAAKISRIQIGIKMGQISRFYFPMVEKFAASILLISCKEAREYFRKNHT